MSRKGDGTRQFIRERAQIIFAEKGFKEVTMSDICEATGLSRGGLYRHYVSTQQIFSEILDSNINLKDNELYIKMEQGLPAPLILDEILELHKSEMLDSKSSLSMAIYEYFSNPQNGLENNILLRQYQDYLAMWNDIIQYGIKRKEIKDVDANAVCDILVFAYQGVRMYSKLMPINEKIPERIIQQIRNLLLL